MAIEDKVWTLLMANLAEWRAENNHAHDEIKAEMKAALVEVQAMRAELNGRVRRLETWRSGICAVGTFVIGLFAVVKWLWKP